MLVDGEAANLGPRAFNLLVVLVERAGQLVTKDEILSRVWPGLVVEENNLQVQISALRKVLGHEAIATVPAVGYRFVLALEPPQRSSDSTAGNSAPAEELSKQVPLGGRADHGHDESAPSLATAGKSRRVLVATALIAVAALAAVSLWTFQHFSRPAPPLTTSPPPMSIAVLPFAAPGGGATEEQLAEALSRDLPAVLARITRYARVTSPDLPAAYKGKAIDARSLGREFNVRYLATGEVRRVGEQIAVSVRLIDTGNATQVLGERLEIDQARLARDQDALLARLALRVRAAARGAETRRFASPPARDASAEELVWHGTAVWSKNESTLKGALEARKWYDEALRRDPSLVRAMTGRERTLRYELDLNLHAERDRLLQEMEEATSRAVWTDPNDPIAWMFRAYTLTRQHRWAAALEAIATAEKLYAPIRGRPLLARADIRLLTGQPTEALLLVEQALVTDLEAPVDVSDAMYVRCQASLALGRYDDAIAACERAVGLYVWWEHHLYLVAAYALKGDLANATAEKRRLLNLRSGISIAHFKALRYSDDPAYLQQIETHLFAGLRKAGIPEQ
ncbi:MAG TPA: winged helix-turn-helix domain-containing protein [Burkholderiaceae bacterium]|nr:winged helix-turn-helix domain-containing protein [Burkholderiaceae bacterium]